MIDGIDMPPPARGCSSTKGTERGSMESIMTFIIKIIKKVTETVTLICYRFLDKSSRNDN